MLTELEAVARGENLRLMIFMPPRHGKSIYGTRLFVPWWLAQHPHGGIMTLSATTELAELFGRRVRNLIRYHRQTLGYSLAADSQAAGRWETSQGGEYLAAGVGKMIQGRPANLAIIDDPVAGVEAAESETQREGVWEWYQNDFLGRLEPGAAVILIQTRWHEDDLAGKLIQAMAQGGEQWRIINLPAIAGPGDALGRQPGEALWPEWMDEAALEARKRAVGSRAWYSLYQQEPRPLEGTLFKPELLLDEERQPFFWPKACDGVFAVIDTATKSGKTHDGTGVSFFSMDTFQPRPLLLLDWDLVQIDGDLLIEWLPSVFTRLEQMARETGARRGSLGVFIEDSAAGAVLNMAARRRGWAVIPIDAKLTRLAKMGKTERAIAVTHFVEGRKIGVTRPAHERTSVYHGRSRNHWWYQVTGFWVGQAESGAEDDLLDTFCYAASLALDGFTAPVRM